MKHSHSHLHNPIYLPDLPFNLEEEDIDKDWEPEIGQEYMIIHSWKDDDAPNILVGKFSPVWFGWNFHFFWGANSLQLSTESYSDDWKRFKQVFKLTRQHIIFSSNSASSTSNSLSSLPEPLPNEEFLEKSDVEL